nr:hypothetical protein [Salinirubrum litoreum]
MTTLRRPDQFADWYRIGADYVLEVAEGLDLALGDFPTLADEATEAMRAGRTDVRAELARSIAADLYADAAFCEPYLEWTPLWYELALLAPVRYADARLRRVAGRYASDLGHVSVPQFSRPKDVLVGGRPAFTSVSGFRNRFLFADALLHVEWFVHVARESGIEVPESLVARTRRETVEWYASGAEDPAALSPEVREFQRLLFADDRWVRRIDEAYELDSVLFSIWERILREERERLTG